MLVVTETSSASKDIDSTLYRGNSVLVQVPITYTVIRKIGDCAVCSQYCHVMISGALSGALSRDVKPMILLQQVSLLL